MGTDGRESAHLRVAARHGEARTNQNSVRETDLDGYVTAEGLTGNYVSQRWPDEDYIRERDLNGSKRNMSWKGPLGLYASMDDAEELLVPEG
jgi:hypothetical protein